MAERREKRGISRRGLLIGGGATVGLLVAWQLWPRSYAPNLRVGEGEHLFNAFLKIGADGRVIVAVPQAEIGQGVYTSLPQIIADELGADWATVAVEPAPLSPLYANQLYAAEIAGDPLPEPLVGAGRWMVSEYSTRNAVMLTGGSSSIRAFEPRLREAGAAARALLSMAAADRWNADWEDLDTRGGFVVRGSDRIAFADLAETAAGYSLPEHLPVRGGLENRLAGQPLPRIDTPAKVDGSARFAGDVRLPGMVFAAVRSAPPGSTLASLDEKAGESVHGALKVFRNPAWVGVAATNWWSAARAIEKMQPRFTRPSNPPTAASIERALAEALGSAGHRILHQGDVDEQIAAADVVRATYAVGLAPSAPMETLTATVRVVGDLMEIWAPVQAPAFARSAAARATGFAEGRITVHPTLIGSGYGRKFETDAIGQAAVMAVRMGRPVQLTWSRGQETMADRPRPAARADMAARFGNGGTIAAWQARIAVPRTMEQLLDRLGAGMLLGPSDGADVDGAVPPYSIPAVSIERIKADIAIETGLWRSAAHSYTCFFTECFVDELARRAGIEALSFRIPMLADNLRLANALSHATAIGGWDGGPAGSGMGIACHSAFGSHIGLLVEIEITAEQRVRVLRAVAAVDCGRVVNPDLVKQQIEGGIIHGVSGAVGPPLELEHGMPAARTFADLRLPMLADSPEVTVEIIPSEEPPGGASELGVPPVGPAIANALASLTGRRVRSLPLVVGNGGS
ncbi:molybdopterin cofactor-binding domain-containing protein [Allosphingosinicella sp.]|jgi:isoquinoline 1-oxidoreductase beta subunit|uniref:xanthine dehydrogenase family protein molybdopterin-binding subunit n=1 Tax=Allosphingosinicella sp. TaxID=2823234 RepID=UPI002EF6453C